MANNRGWRVKSDTASQAADPAPDLQEVARVAYELYEQRGRADGHDLEDWISAETIVRQRRWNR